MLVDGLHDAHAGAPDVQDGHRQEIPGHVARGLVLGTRDLSKSSLEGRRNCQIWGHCSSPQQQDIAPMSIDIYCFFCYINMFYIFKS